MRIIAFALVSLVLQGRMTTRSFTGPDGNPAYIVTCNGTMRSMADCYDHAAETCRGPYNVLDNNEQQSGFYRMGHSVQQGVKRSLTFSCNHLNQGDEALD